MAKGDKNQSPYYWLKVTQDDLELPLIVEDRASDLAKRTGRAVTTIINLAKLYERTGQNTPYRRVLKRWGGGYSITRDVARMDGRFS